MQSAYELELYERQVIFYMMRDFKNEITFSTISYIRQYCQKLKLNNRSLSSHGLELGRTLRPAALIRQK